jgi:hypothetical protein
MTQKRRTATTADAIMCLLAATLILAVILGAPL